MTHGLEIGAVTDYLYVGPIFDAYGPNYVIIPGSIGIVVAMICLSFSKGAYLDWNPDMCRTRG